MLITGTEGFSPVQKKNTARLTGAAGDRRTQETKEAAARMLLLMEDGE